MMRQPFVVFSFASDCLTTVCDKLTNNPYFGRIDDNFPDTFQPILVNLMLSRKKTSQRVGR
jgi:hypothetical protein